MMKKALANNLKNIKGWSSQRRIVCFAVDDFGVIRLASESARADLLQAGMRSKSWMDEIDTMESTDDLESLFEVLSNFKDFRGTSPSFTAYTVVAVPDFERILQTGDYSYHSLPKYFETLEAKHGQAYSSVWQMWLEGVQKGFLFPQFHGREHFNLPTFLEKLISQDSLLIRNLELESLAGISDDPCQPYLGFTHAYEPVHENETALHKTIIEDGLDMFEKIFGFRSVTFTPPALKLHPSLYGYLESLGILAIDKPFFCNRRLGSGRARIELNALGRKRGQKHITLVRNVMFEPSKRAISNPVGLALDQVAAAFRWGKPAVISSHRVNYVGHIDENNRKIGLAGLKSLLTEIVRRWPDVEFMTTPQLVETIRDTET